MAVPVIAAFDIATKTGVCWGSVGQNPDVATWDMREAGPSRHARLHSFFQQLEAFLEESPGVPPFDQVWYEEPMNVGVMNRIGASNETIALLRGMIGVLEVCCVRAKIKKIGIFKVQDARQHLTGQRTFAKNKYTGKGTAKTEVMRVAQMLGVKVTDDNQADAYAGWSYACGLANPRLSHLVTPLFASAR